ncbi:MAG TPA: ferritin [Eubacteriaceae bacterium]|nr:ferritin [Eubacteriaceae bacterium]
MLSDKLIFEMNEQIKYEFFSSHLYLSMAAYCAENDFPGFEKWFIDHAAEERTHGMDFYEFLNDRDAKAVFRGFEDPKETFNSLRDVYEYALEHEKFVTSRIYKLMDIAQEEKEYASINFLNKYVEEQVEEEALFSGILARVIKAGDNQGALMNIDRQMGSE